MEVEKIKENESVRIALKFLRQKGFKNAFEALLVESEKTLEHELVSTFYELIVTNGDYDNASNLLKSPRMEPLLKDAKPTQKGRWIKCAPDGTLNYWPGARGGHQMVIYDEKCYLFGGWTGGADLGDFWVFDIKRSKWSQISENVREQGGPSPRSCHKMCIDPARGIIYTFGRYVDAKTKHRETVTSDFYQYEIHANTWTCISDNVELEGGPALIFDHQVVFDGSTRTMWSFGGRIIVSRTDVPLEEQRATSSGRLYSGLYKWVC
jgi:hypothetical protein